MSCTRYKNSLSLKVTCQCHPKHTRAEDDESSHRSGYICMQIRAIYTNTDRREVLRTSKKLHYYRGMQTRRHHVDGPEKRVHEYRTDNGSHAVAGLSDSAANEDYSTPRQ